MPLSVAAVCDRSMILAEYLRRSSTAATAKRLVILRDRVPIYHVPPCFDVIGSAVLVLEVVSMFPNIEADNRCVAIHQRTILIRRRHHFEFTALIFDQPNPTAAKSTRPPGREFFLERIDAAEG